MKRFTETSKWEDPWFRKLKPKFKTLFLLICDKCDSAGVWNVDLELAETFIGEKLDVSQAVTVLDGRIVDLGDGKWLIPQFIPFQYGELTEHCKPHRPILKLVEAHGLVKDGKGYRKGIETLPGKSERGADLFKEKEKEKEKEKDSSGGTGEIQPPLLVLTALPPEPSLDDLAAEIYELYPLKVARPDAIRAIKAALKSSTSTFLRERTEAYAKAVKGTDTFIPHPATWFNGNRFNDASETWVRRSNTETESTHANSQRNHPFNGSRRPTPADERNARVTGAESARARIIAASNNPKAPPWAGGLQPRVPEASDAA